MALSLGDVLAQTAQLQPKQPATRSARSRNRASAWAHDLAQWREYRCAMSGSDAERASIEVEYQRRMLAGPDFQAYHAGSQFAEPHTHSMTKADRSAILTAFDAVRDWHYRNLREPHGQAISKIYKEVLGFLTGVAVKYQRVFPSLATIARACCCSVRTVSNALRWLESWGFLSWQRRLARKPGRLGARVVQASNAYKLALSGLAAIGARVFSGSDGNKNHPSRFQRQLQKLLASRPDAGAASGSTLIPF